MWPFSVFHLACCFKRLLFCTMYLIPLHNKDSYIWRFHLFCDSLCNLIWPGIRQPSLELAFLPQPPKCWYFRCAPFLLTCIHVFFSFWSFERHWGSFPVWDLQIVQLGTYCLQVFEWMCVFISPGYVLGLELLGCMVTLYNWPRSVKLFSNMSIS